MHRTERQREAPPSLCSFRAVLKASFGNVAPNPILPNPPFVGKPCQQHVKHEAGDVPSKTRASSSDKRYHSKQADIYVDGLKTEAVGFSRCLCPLPPAPSRGQAQTRLAAPGDRASAVVPRGKGHCCCRKPSVPHAFCTDAEPEE